MSLLARTEAAPAAAVRPIRVFLADDHPLTLWGLRQLVQSDHPRMSLAGTASTCAELLAHEALAQTDVVLLDLGLGDGNTIECLAQLVESAGVQVVVLTGDLNPAHHREAVLRGARGARGVVVKSQPTGHILEAIQRVHAGEVWLDGALMSMLLGAVPRLPAAGPARADSAAARIATLTPRERLVIQTVVQHRGTKSLLAANALGMSENTLRNHLTVIYSKLGVQRRLGLYLFAIEHRLASDPARNTRPSTPGDHFGQFDPVWARLA